MKPAVDFIDPVPFRKSNPNTTPLIRGESDLDNQINRAKAAGAEGLKNEPRAKAARYSPTRRQVIVELTNGCSLFFRWIKRKALLVARHDRGGRTCGHPEGKTLPGIIHDGNPTKTLLAVVGAAGLKLSVHR